MSNSYRIRTTVGKDTSIKVNIEQDFEYLEILSLKVLQSEVYTRQCSDYGVVVGRVSVNNGFGIPNAKVSIFIPLTEEDSLDPIISDLYPYKTLTDVNVDGYRYNLLPYTRQHSNHTPTGTFFEKSDILLDKYLIEVFDKYYKYTTTTNDSGDFMLFGVPVGQQTLFVDLDLSDMGEFSLTPKDLIRLGLATEEQVNKNKFKSSTNLDSLPQLITFNRNIEVEPFWGQPDICSLGITRTDFDLSKEAGIDIKPNAIFMGSMFSSPDEQLVKKSGKVNKKTGELCSLITGPGEIKAIRQTIGIDDLGRPVLEQFELENGGQVIDENGTWLIDLPMNMDYMTTDEYGNRVISNNPQVGVPTRGKYRFKVKWNQSPTMESPVKRGYFLVPNIREYGWGESNDVKNPIEEGGEYLTDFNTSYAFSLNWDDYGYTGTTSASTYYSSGLKHIEDAINCEDKFYDFSYNKVYTVSELISQFRTNINDRRFIGIKDIISPDCESENNKFPSNDGQFNNNVIFTLFRIIMFLMYPIIFTLTVLLHVVSFIVVVILGPLFLILAGQYLFFSVQEGASAVSALLSVPPNIPLMTSFILKSVQYLAISATFTGLFFLLNKIKKYFKNFKLPNYTFPDCDFCECDPLGSQDLSTLEASQNTTPNTGASMNAVPVNNNGSALLTPLYMVMNYSATTLDGSGGGALGGIFGGQPIPGQGRIGTGVGTTVNGIASGEVPFSPQACECPDGATQLNEYLYVVYDGDGNPSTNYFGTFSTDLPLPERINLFNVKAKYFNNTIPNIEFNSTAEGGNGVNQIKVKFDTVLNPSPSTYHLDNVVMMFVQPDVASNFTNGKLITFQDVKKSHDINYTGSSINDYGTFSITGSSILSSSVPTPVNVEWANPDGSGNNITTYNLTGKTEDALFQQYPMDVEYFQVITGMTYGEYRSKLDVNSTLQNSLNSRYLDNEMYTLHISRTNKTAVQPSPIGKIQCDKMRYFSYNPLEEYNDYNKQQIVFLVRGVDPHSSRTTCEYDLSKLFGYNTFGNVKVSGQYKLNIPIQGKPLNVKHSGDNHTIDTYSNVRLYHKSYHFLPGSQMNGFTTTLTQYYSGLDKDYSIHGGSDLNGSKVDSDYYSTNKENFDNSSIPRNSIGNDYTTRWVNKYGNGEDEGYEPSVSYPNNIVNKPCYYLGEHIEGGTYLRMSEVNIHKPANCFCSNAGTTCVKTEYACPKITDTFTINKTNNVNDNYIVMRSDRLPLSTFDFKPNPDVPSYRPLHANVGFEVFVIEDGGLTGDVKVSSGVLTNGDGDLDSSNPLNSLQCGKLLPLGCYKSEYNPSTNKYEFKVATGQELFDCQTTFNRPIMEKGCYVLVSIPFLTLPRDIVSITEWRTRMLINFAACQNVFSHVFSNNWVNGTLFAFPFANKRKFDGSNKPYSLYPKKLVHLDTKTQNFYYRSAPYTNDGKFVGQEITLNFKGNKHLLNYPTTIMDLGPRDLFTQEVARDDQFDGYVVNRLGSTSFNDVSDLLNLFILNRITSSGFLNSMAKANINTYFSRSNNFIDGDYAQMNAINSEFGVVPFDDEEYDGSSVYSNPSDDSTIGVFFSSNTQNRDFISPKRNLYSENGNITNQACYSYIPVKSQEVPFYQWEIKYFDVIFGNDENEWYTNGINGEVFFSYKYQELDRLKSDSRYFRGNQSSITKDFKGYIYSIDSSGNYVDNITSWDRNNPNPDTVLTGAPFYFYFGLKRGKTAFDRFGKTWLDFENIEE